MSAEPHLIRFIQRLHVIGPFLATEPTPELNTYSARDAITDLMVLLCRLHTVSFFNVVLDELPIHPGACPHIKVVKLLFCSSSIMGMNAFMSHFTHLDVLKLAWPEPTLMPLYFYQARFLREENKFFLHTVFLWREVLQRAGLPVIDTVIIRPGIDTDPFEWFVNKSAWYDPENIRSVYLSGETAAMGGLGQFLKILGSGMSTINIRTDGKYLSVTRIFL